MAIEKRARRLILLRQGQVLKTYRVSLGSRPAGAKEREGGQRTPEGRYLIARRNPKSAFHRTLLICPSLPAGIAIRHILADGSVVPQEALGPEGRGDRGAQPSLL